MAKRRQWRATEKSRILLEGLRGGPVADTCVEYQISQSMYYSWRDQFLSNMGQVFETKKIDQREAYQNRQIDKMNL